MRKFFFAVLACLLVSPAFAQFNYDSALSGERVSLLAPLDVQCELDYYTAPWGSVLEGDPDVVFFGVLSQPNQDVLVLDIKWLGSSSGYAPSGGGPSLQNMQFQWRDDIGSYISLVSMSPTKLAFQAITIKEGQGTWRVGHLVFDISGYPWWIIADDFLQEWSVKQQTLEPWRWSQGRRAAPNKGKE